MSTPEDAPIVDAWPFGDGAIVRIRVNVPELAGIESVDAFVTYSQLIAVASCLSIGPPDPTQLTTAWEHHSVDEHPWRNEPFGIGVSKAHDGTHAALTIKAAGVHVFRRDGVSAAAMHASRSIITGAHARLPAPVDAVTHTSTMTRLGAQDAALHAHRAAGLTRIQSERDHAHHERRRIHGGLAVLRDDEIQLVDRFLAAMAQRSNPGAVPTSDKPIIVGWPVGWTTNEHFGPSGYTDPNGPVDRQLVYLCTDRTLRLTARVGLRKRRETREITVRPNEPTERTVSVTSWDLGHELTRHLVAASVVL